MSDMRFHVTQVKVGVVKWEAGEVVEMAKSKSLGDTFSHCVILGFSEPNKHGDVYAKLARPYAFPSSVGTTCPTPLLGCEVFEVTVNSLMDNFVRVGTMTIMHP